MGHPPLAKWATEHTQRQHNPPATTSTAITIGSNAALEVRNPSSCQNMHDSKYIVALPKDLNANLSYGAHSQHIVGLSIP